MRLRCDHCRRPLGLMVRRYWHMRFCSAGCVQAYQQRLQDGTKDKIARLGESDRDARGMSRFTGRLFGSHARPEANRRLAG
jgi:hypothetical protein